MNILNKKSKAFTLMEVVVILFVLSIGILSVISLMRRSLQFKSLERNLVIATYLSQEGIEVIKNIRDTNIILGLDYDNFDGFGSAGIGTSTYKVDYYGLLATSSISIDDSILQFDNNGFFRHLESGENSIFKRLITVRAETTASTSIESWVRWSEKGQNYDYKLETILYDLSP